MKRLIKESLMNPEVFENSLNQLSMQGRQILKALEDYKFKIEQTCRITANDQQLTQKLIQKKKQLDIASGQVYSIVFDIENYNITTLFDQQQINTSPVQQSKETNKSIIEEKDKIEEDKQDKVEEKEENKDDSNKEKNQEEGNDK